MSARAKYVAYHGQRITCAKKACRRKGTTRVRKWGTLRAEIWCETHAHEIGAAMDAFDDRLDARGVKA